MNFLTVISVICLLAYTNGQCPAGYRTIQTGDTFYALGGNNWAGACAWLNSNPTVNPCTLKAGDCVVAPSATTSTYCPQQTNANAYIYSSCYNGYNNNANYYGTGQYTGPYYGCPAGYYQIQSGNTFYGLGGNNWGGACAWLNANPGVDPCNLRVGQCVRAPISGSTSTYCPQQTTASCYSGYNNNANYYGSGYYSGTNYGTGYYTGPNNACPLGYYQIKSGDTFYGLGANGWAGACAWLNANPGVNPCTLQVGQCVAAPNSGTYTQCPSATTSNYGCFSGLNSAPSNYYGNGYYNGGSYYGCPAGFYQIKSGDTFYALGGNNWGGACSWWNANPGLNPCGLQVGQCVVAPTSTTGTYCGSGASTAYNGCYSGLNNAPSNYYGSGSYNGYSYGCPAGYYQIKSGDTYYGLAGSNWAGACAWLNANPSYNPCNLQPGQCVNYPVSGTNTQCPYNTANTYSSCYSGLNYAGNYWGSGAYSYPSNSNTHGYPTCSYGQRTIASGDTFWNYAGGSQAGACAWMAANPGVDPCSLWVGYCVNNPAYSNYNQNSNCVLPSCWYGKK